MKEWKLKSLIIYIAYGILALAVIACKIGEDFSEKDVNTEIFFIVETILKLAITCIDILMSIVYIYILRFYKARRNQTDLDLKDATITDDENSKNKKIKLKPQFKGSSTSASSR